MRLFLLFLATLAGAATLRQAEDQHWVMDNGILRVEIDPTRGARVSSCRYRDLDRDFVRAKTQGLFMDHESLQRWPGELLERAYTATPGPIDGDEVALTCAATLEGSFKGATFPRTAGVGIRKTFRLRDGEAALRVTYELHNGTDGMRQFGLWVQNVLNLAADPRQDVAIRPYETGVVRFPMGDQPHGWAWRNWPGMTAGWTGVVDPTSDVGVFFFPDYNWLDAHYNAGRANSVEFFMTRTPLPPGRSWTTDVTMVVRQVPRDLVAIGAATWLGARLSKDESTLIFTNGGAKAHFAGVLHDPLHNRQFAVALDLPPGETQWPLPAEGRAPYFLSGRFGDLGVEEFLGGRMYLKNEAYEGGPPAYTATPPPKQPEFLKPDTIALTPDAGNRVLLVHGVMTVGMGLRPALEAASLTVTEAYERRTSLMADVVGFPSDYETMLGCGTLVLANVNTSRLTVFQRELVGDWLRAGGRIVGFGGTALTADAWADSPLAAWTQLPAATLVTEGAAVRAVWPDDRTSVRATVGKGRVVLCGRTGMGRTEPADYWQSTAWRQLVAQLLETP